MTQVLRSIKNIGLYLLGLVLIVAGQKVNDVHVQTKEDAARLKSKELAEQAEAQGMTQKSRETDKTAPRKPKTTVEKAKPEQASASKNTNGKPAGASATQKHRQSP